jgi:putative two-component system response regulator
MRRTIYVVDDVPTNIELVEAVFRNDRDLTIESALNGRELMDLIGAKGYPDLLILDLMMPLMDGFDVLTRLKDKRSEQYFPIIILSALTDKQSIIRALSFGADDYVTKPFFVEELKARVYNMLKLKERDEFLHTSIDFLESNLLEKLGMLEHTQLEIVIRLGRAAEFRDNETGKHVERIADYVNLIAKELRLDRDQTAMMRFASPMHDVGKIGIPDGVLLKPGKLTFEEFKIIQLHTIMGGKILAGTSLPLLELATEIAMSHHEHWNGNGYPFGIKGKNIPISGRVVAIADVFDALTSERVYKSAWPMERALDYIKDQREQQFDPDVVDAFFNVVSHIIDIKKSKADEPATKPIIQQVIDGDVSMEELVERWR